LIEDIALFAEGSREVAAKSSRVIIRHTLPRNRLTVKDELGVIDGPCMNSNSSLLLSLGPCAIWGVKLVMGSPHKYIPTLTWANQ
jgi:hypothetical protein